MIGTGDLAESPRILHVDRVSFVGGVERVILTLSEGLADEGYQVVLACPEGGDLPRIANAMGVDTVGLPIDRMRITSDPVALARYALMHRTGSRALTEICRSRRIDLLHAHHPVGALYALRARKVLGVPLVLHVHEIGPARPLYALAMRYVARRVDRAIACSTAGRDLFVAFGGDPGLVDVVHNGVPRRFVQEARSAVPVRLGHSRPHVGIFGVIEPRKGQSVFLEAARRVLHLFPEATFWIVGGVALKDKAEYRQTLTRMACAPPLAGHVRFVGNQEDVGAWMNAMDVVALASVSDESLPMVVLEAMSLARPTVASRIGGTPEIIRDGETGRLVPPGDPEALADGILSLLGKEGRRMGWNALHDASSRFSGKAFSRNVASVYDLMLRSTPRPSEERT